MHTIILNPTRLFFPGKSPCSSDIRFSDFVFISLTWIIMPPFLPWTRRNPVTWRRSFYLRYALSTPGKTPWPWPSLLIITDYPASFCSPEKYCFIYFTRRKYLIINYFHDDLFYLSFFLLKLKWLILLNVYTFNKWFICTLRTSLPYSFCCLSRFVPLLY